jgi:hypothetical protein
VLAAPEFLRIDAAETTLSTPYNYQPPEKNSARDNAVMLALVLGERA